MHKIYNCNTSCVARPSENSPSRHDANDILTRPTVHVSLYISLLLHKPLSISLLLYIYPPIYISLFLYVFPFTSASFFTYPFPSAFFYLYPLYTSFLLYVSLSTTPLLYRELAVSSLIKTPTRICISMTVQTTCIFILHSIVATELSHIHMQTRINVANIMGLLSSINYITIIKSLK